jgi:hypothetical protein
MKRIFEAMKLPITLAATAAMVSAAFLSLASITSANAQGDEHPSHIPTRQIPNTPFSHQFSKPIGTTGGQIYNDPRVRDPNGPRKQSRGCPAPTLYDPASGGCR